ncbi:MAG TPA: hypothetical protein PLU26_16940 [Candidatus Competibacter sp.]|nr:hypothetical protein [Candidatus Competibacter sp.]
MSEIFSVSHMGILIDVGIQPFAGLSQLVHFGDMGRAGAFMGVQITAASLKFHDNRTLIDFVSLDA